MGNLRQAEIEYVNENGVTFGIYKDTQEKFIVGGDPLAIAPLTHNKLSILEFTEFLKLSEVEGSEADFVAQDFTGKVRKIIAELKGFQGE